jgi:hypothetical protein
MLSTHPAVIAQESRRVTWGAEREGLGTVDMHIFRKQRIFFSAGRVNVRTFPQGLGKH